MLGKRVEDLAKAVVSFGNQINLLDSICSDTELGIFLLFLDRSSCQTETSYRGNATE